MKNDPFCASFAVHLDPISQSMFSKKEQCFQNWVHIREVWHKSGTPPPRLYVSPPFSEFLDHPEILANLIVTTNLLTIRNPPTIYGSFQRFCQSFSETNSIGSEPIGTPWGLNLMQCLHLIWELRKRKIHKKIQKVVFHFMKIHRFSKLYRKFWGDICLNQIEE